MNIFCNFFIIVIFGFVIFFEVFLLLWWMGVVMFVVGNVIIGSKDEGVKEVVMSDGVSVDGILLVM